MPGDPLGLIAGEGELPGEIARAAAARGRPLLVVAFPSLCDPGLARCAAEIAWLDPGQVGAALAFLRGHGVREAVMAGKVARTALVAGRLQLDERAREIFSGLADLRDQTLLAAVAGALEEEGIELLPQAQLVPDLLAPEAVLGRVNPTPAQERDVAYGAPLAHRLAALDIGQTVVVQDRAVVAVEAMEGTDEAIRRAGRLGRPGLCIVKAARPGHDPRFDLPTVGPRTRAVAAASGAGVVAVEAGRTIVLNREAVVARADAAGIALVGWSLSAEESAQASARASGDAD
jgi:DUF1009 family protein